MGGGKLGVVGVASLRASSARVPILGAQTTWAVRGAAKRGHWGTGRVRRGAGRDKRATLAGSFEIRHPCALRKTNPTLQSPTE